MTYQIIYSSKSTAPMLSEDLEPLLERARRKNAIEGISGALIYADGTFLQILEGEQIKLQALMAEIGRDPRHRNVTVLRESEMPSARFKSWKMAYVSATPEQVAQWAGDCTASAKGNEVNDVREDLQRTARFARDILALLTPEEPDGAPRGQDVASGPT